jgi:SAM-dependent methyltransferase
LPASNGSPGQRPSMPSRELEAFSGTFHAPAGRVRWLSEVICASLADAGRSLRVLEIGCGAGDQLFDLAARLPGSRLVGIDVAAANITAAQERCPEEDRERIAFERVDYRAYRTAEPFDVLIADSVLQWVPGDADLLASRIADDAAPGALFFNLMPYRCAFNHTLRAVRRGLRFVRGPAVDRALFHAARVLHGSFDERLLAERVGYAYNVPLQFEDEIARALQARGFQSERREPIAHASPAQMKHLLRVMKRVG